MSVQHEVGTHWEPISPGLLSELAFAFPTHEDDDANGAQNPCTDEPTDPQAVPIIVERTVFIFRVVGVQGRQARQDKEQAQDHLLHDGALACVAPQAACRFQVQPESCLYLQLPRPKQTWAKLGR